MERIKGWKDNVNWLGRTIQKDGVVYFNWTNSGCKFSYSGTCLIIQLKAICSYEQDAGEETGAQIERENWPYISVFYDEEAQPAHTFAANKQDGKYLIFSSEKSETHVITLRKISENATGKAGCVAFWGDGVIEALPKSDYKLKIEFIGDSITCGFGNMTNERDRAFYAEEENGWMSHAAIAGRLLEADANLISCSGIPLTSGVDSEIWPSPGMDQVYFYTDWFMQEEWKEDKKTEWDFEHNRKDVIIINLGTNDSAVIDLCRDITAGIRNFEDAYINFLKKLRSKNGKQPWIICSLGPLDYYLYDNIEKAVMRYKEEEQDERVCCFKYMKVRIGEGYGACGHPSMATQKRMAEEIADFIRNLLDNEDEEAK